MITEKSRVNFNATSDWIEKVDVYAKQHNVNRTNAIIMLCNYAIDFQETIEIMPSLLDVLKGNRQTK